jgi:hypothetical protein
MFVRRAAILSSGYRSLIRPTTTNRLFLGYRALARPAATTSPFSSLSSKQFSVSHIAMAESTSGVTAEGVKEKLTVQLEAQFVEIEDMSGNSFLYIRVIIITKVANCHKQAAAARRSRPSSFPPSSIKRPCSRATGWSTPC